MIDITAKIAIRSFLKEIKQELGVTILLTTHDLKDIEELCEKVIIIDQGHLVYSGSLVELKNKMGNDGVLKFHISSGQFTEKLEQLNHNDLMRWCQPADNEITVEFERDRTSRAEVIRIALEHFNVEDISMAEPGIEEVVNRVYQSGISERV